MRMEDEEVRLDILCYYDRTERYSCMSISSKRVTTEGGALLN